MDYFADAGSGGRGESPAAASCLKTEREKGRMACPKEEKGRQKGGIKYREGGGDGFF
jgi:hypothetical protein